MAEAKRIKSSNGNVGNDNKIKASGDVVEKIISFLPIKRDPEFTLISTRFENIWCHSRVFSFGIDFVRGRVREDIILIINRAFESHLGTKIQQFSLYFDPTDLEDLVNYWIRNAVDKGVEDLDLDFSEGKVAFKIDFALIDAKSLRTLKLTKCIIDVPPKLKGLRFLKSLFLHKVKIYVWATLHLFSNCLLLESLKLVSCIVSQNLNVVAQNLKKFKVLIIEHCHSISSINIDARTLCSLHYHGEFCNINLNSTFPQLDDVILDFTPAKGFQNVSQVKKLIMGLTYVNVLTVTSTFLEGLSPSFATDKLCEPQFCLSYLKEFHLSIGTTFINPCDIASFLENCPNLERIFIDLGESSFEWGYLWEVQARERFEQCNPSLQSLKVVKVTGFKIQKPELELVMFILKKARNLETLALVSSRNNQPEVNSQDARLFYFQIIACRISPTATVEMFEYLDDKSSIHPRHPRVGRKFLRGQAHDD